MQINSQELDSADEMLSEPRSTKGELRQRMKDNRKKSMDISRQCRHYMNTKMKAY